MTISQSEEDAESSVYARSYLEFHLAYANNPPSMPPRRPPPTELLAPCDPLFICASVFHRTIIDQIVCALAPRLDFGIPFTATLIINCPSKVPSRPVRSRADHNHHTVPFQTRPIHEYSEWQLVFAEGIHIGFGCGERRA